MRDRVWTLYKPVPATALRGRHLWDLVEAYYTAHIRPLTLRFMTFSALEYKVVLLLIQTVQCIPSGPLDKLSPWFPRVSTGLGAPISECATLPEYPQWFQPSQKFDIGDCSQAIDIFYHDYVKDHGPIPYEFLTSGVDPVHGIPTQRVPLKVSSGKP